MNTVNEYQREFLEILLKEEVFYPWNPAQKEVEEYFTQQQEDFSFADSLNSEEFMKIDSSLYEQA